MLVAEYLIDNLSQDQDLHFYFALDIGVFKAIASASLSKFLGFRVMLDPDHSLWEIYRLFCAVMVYGLLTSHKHWHYQYFRGVAIRSVLSHHCYIPLEEVFVPF
jgi:hypothetical protein